MRKDAFILTLTTFVLGIFGFFLRWLQNVNAFEPDTGLAIMGAATTTVYLFYTAAAVAVMLAMVYLHARRRYELPTLGGEALVSSTVFHSALLWLIAAVVVIVSLVLMFGSDFARFPTMQRVMSALGILAGLSIPFILPRRKAVAEVEGENADSAGIAGTAAVIPILFGCLWMVTAYRVHSENPILWQYVIEVLAVVAVTMSFYYVAAWFYGKAKPCRCLVAVQLASYLCLSTLTDEHSSAEGVLFAAMAVLMLFFQFVIIENAKRKE